MTRRTTKLYCMRFEVAIAVSVMLLSGMACGAKEGPGGADVGEDGTGSGDGGTSEGSGEGGGDGGGAVVCTTGDDPSAMNAYRDDWRVEVDGAPLPDEVMQVTVGGTEVGENFRNGGDVDVLFTGPPGEITVELRRFTTAPDQAAADEDFERLQLWAYAAGIEPPGPSIEDQDCSSQWAPGCKIRVWFNGQIQPQRLGVDFRVTMPAGWIGEVVVVTGDTETLDSQLRGDVRIDQLVGFAEVELDAGRVEVKMADDALEAPGCGKDLVQACWNFVDPETQQPDPWSLKCGCTEFGRLTVESRPEKAASVTVDMPGALWATANMENTQPGLQADSDPLCTATYDCSGIGSCLDLSYDESFPWQRLSEFNDPGESAITGLGYRFDLTSEACRNVPAFSFATCETSSSPRGNLEICSGCVD